MAEKKQRIAIWDNYKCILILGVVLGHMYARFDELDNVKRLILFIYSFHMPAFVFVSGLFAKKTIREKRWDKVIGFFLLFLLAKVGRYSYPSITSGENKFVFWNMNDVTWYAFAMFVFCLFTILLTVACKHANAAFILVISIVVSVLAGFVDRFGTFLSLSRIFAFYPFFYLGYVLEAKQVQQFVSKKWVKAAAVFFLLAVVLLLFVRLEDCYRFLYVFKSKTPYSKWKCEGMMPVAMRLFWYVYASIFSLAVLALTPVKQSILTIIGSRTMTIYTWHYLLMFLFYSSLHGEDIIKKVLPVHYLVLVFAVSVLITGILAWKPFSMLTERIVYPHWIHSLFEKGKNATYERS